MSFYDTLKQVYHDKTTQVRDSFSQMRNNLYMLPSRLERMVSPLQPAYLGPSIETLAPRSALIPLTMYNKGRSRGNGHVPDDSYQGSQGGSNNGSGRKLSKRAKAAEARKRAEEESKRRAANRKRNQDDDTQEQRDATTKARQGANGATRGKGIQESEPAQRKTRHDEGRLFW
ncbi:hypothetical protein J4460_03235 [Candidatus Woesearchaeota archaeon]|nr:hypothetical protein [Candidatus Woesearchaeota archaeon]HIH38765.1 hypothetical protein [Candidatus Woesearchaeota archaeon]HIH49181.1 hypothetical protein [Candidatus Woesearchaeota archaeon]HIJ03323.1 hypothetical protein [Candidatus Woesearchaeota archaeon]